MKSPILGASYVARSINAADNRMVNLFPEAVVEGGKEPAFLSRCPGLRLVLDVGSGPIRGMHKFLGILYVVSGGELYSVSKSYLTSFIGVISGSGQVSMADNGIQLFIAANPDGYIYNASTSAFAQITDPDFPGAKKVGYLDGYFVFIQPTGQQLWITSLYDGSSIDPLDFASAEGSPDGLVSMEIDHREVWLFGTDSVEVWYNAGTADFPLIRIQGAFIEAGCSAAYSVAKLDNSLFWLGSDARGSGLIYRANGYSAVRISTHAIEYAISEYGDVSDAIAYSYQQEGHSFYVITFPSVSKTWAFDVSTGLWHERAGFEYGNFVRHRPQNHVNFNNENMVGDYGSGNIFAFDMDCYTDNGTIQKWLRSWRALHPRSNNLKRTIHHSLQIDMESGTGLNTGQGSDPAILIRWSNDSGHKWGNYHPIKTGKIGETGLRAKKNRLGITKAGRDRVYEISGTDPVKIAIMGAELTISPTDS